MAKVIGAEQRLEVDHEDNWGEAANFAGGGLLGILLEGEGFQVDSKRVVLELITSQNAPNHGVAKQLTSGIDVTGNFAAILDTANVDYLLSMIDRDPVTGKLRVPGWSFRKDKGYEVVDYLGCKLNSTTISGSPGEAVRFVADVIAREELVPGGPPTVSLPTDGAQYMHWAADVTWKGTSLCEIEDWSLTIEQNLAPGPHSYCPPPPTPAADPLPQYAVISFLEETVLRLTGSFTIAVEDDTWRQDIRADTTGAFVVNLHDGVGSANDKTITVPNAKIIDATPGGPTGDLQRVTVNFVAGADPGGVLFSYTNVTPPTDGP